MPTSRRNFSNDQLTTLQTEAFTSPEFILTGNVNSLFIAINASAGIAIDFEAREAYSGADYTTIGSIAVDSTLWQDTVTKAVAEKFTTWQWKDIGPLAIRYKIKAVTITSLEVLTVHEATKH